MFNLELDIMPFFLTFNVIYKIVTFNSPASSVFLCVGNIKLFACSFGV